MKSFENLNTCFLPKPEIALSTLCFTNGNVILPIEIAKKGKYSIENIANILNISCQEVCNQFNRMIKESDYKLFN